MESKYYTNLGKSVFFTWENLDSIAQKWVSKRFCNKLREKEIFSYVARDENSLNIELTGLSFSGLDQKLWGEIFDKYDKEHNYCAAEEFEVGECPAIIPSTMSLRILSEAAVIHAGLDFPPKALFANSVGVIFTELAPSSLAPYFTADAEEGGEN